MSDFGIVLIEGFYLSAAGAFTDTLWQARRHVNGSLSSIGHDLRMQSGVLLLATNGRSQTSSADGRIVKADASFNKDMLFRALHIASFELAEDDVQSMFSREASLISSLADCAGKAPFVGNDISDGADMLISAGGAGVLLLAEAGLLNGRSASVPQELVGIFRRRYPKIGIERPDTVTQAANIFTAGALAGQISLAAKLITASGSLSLGQFLVNSLGLAAELRVSWQIAADPLVAAAQYWISSNYQRSFRVTDVADTLAVSHKTLIRKFVATLHMTPLAYVQMIRIETARRMLEITNLAIDGVANAVGYSDATSFRKIFTRYNGQSPATYRASFSKQTDPE